MLLRRLTVVVSLVLALLVVPAMAQQDVMSEEEYDATMKQVRATFGGIEDHVTSQDGTALAVDGQALADLFTKVEAFWTARATEEAVGFAATALEAARELGAAGEAGQFDAASTAFQNLRGACQGCHRQFRERTEDGYRIKGGS